MDLSTLLFAKALFEKYDKAKEKAKVFDTVAQMNSWLSTPGNKDELFVGENIFIRDANVPDYWWDGTRALESESNLDLSYGQLSGLPRVILNETAGSNISISDLIDGVIYDVKNNITLSGRYDNSFSIKAGAIIIKNTHDAYYHDCIMFGVEHDGFYDVGYYHETDSSLDSGCTYLSDIPSALLAISNILDLKQDALIAGSGIDINGNVISSTGGSPELQEFVSALPVENIDENKEYLMLNANLFPSVNSYLSDGYTTLIVCKDDYDNSGTDTIRFLRIVRSGSWSNSKGLYSKWDGPRPTQYEIYKVNEYNELEIVEEEQTNSDWATKMKLPTSGYKGVSNCIKNCIYANEQVTYDSYDWERTILYNNSNNVTDIYGIPVDPSLINPYSWLVYKYKNNAWQLIGINDYQKLFEEVIGIKLVAKTDLTNYYTKTETNTLLNAKADASALASKLDTNQGSANVGKVMTVGNDGSLTPQVAQGTTYTAGQNISIANNVISAGIEVIEI